MIGIVGVCPGGLVGNARDNATVGVCARYGARRLVGWWLLQHSIVKWKQALEEWHTAELSGFLASLRASSLQECYKDEKWGEVWDKNWKKR